MAGHDVQGFEGVVDYFDYAEQTAEHHGRTATTLLTVQHDLVTGMTGNKGENVVHDVEYVD